MTDNPYVFGNQKEETELARLIGQGRAMNSAVGDLIPPTLAVESLRQVLDLGSGAGDWCLEVASAFPHCRVVGADISEYMVKYATAQAEVRQVSNVRFVAGNVLETSMFADQTFSLVNSRFSSSYIRAHQWPELLRRWKMLLHPGGCLNICEMDIGSSNSRAIGQLLQWFCQFAMLSGSAFGQGFSIATATVMPRFMREAGFNDLQLFSYPYEWSTGTEYHDVLLQNTLTVAKYAKPVVVGRLGVSADEFDATIEEALLDGQRDDFSALASIFSIVGFV
jgi:ubiquinone/menaquinone biosynthesis C-methylase UbiE